MSDFPQILEKIYSNANNAFQALEVLKDQTLNEVEVACLSWVYHRWASIPNRYEHSSYYGRYFQCNILGWGHREDEEYEKGKEIRKTIRAILLEKNLDADKYIAAAEIFNLAYVECIYVGNGEVGSYKADCRLYWKKFSAYKKVFEEALSFLPQLVNEWVTLGQVLWNHYRFGQDGFNGKFSFPAAKYFLLGSLQLKPDFPIHYYVVLKIREEVDLDCNVTRDEEILEWKTPLGATYYYAAQLLQQHTLDKQQALGCYQKFIDLEGENVMPQNDFMLFDRDARWRSLPPTSQGAIAAMASLKLEMNDLREALVLAEKAIAMDPDNRESPYEVASEIYDQLGDKDQSMEFLNKKVEVALKLKSRDIVLIYTYDPLQKTEYMLGDYNDTSTRMSVFLLHQAYQKVIEYWIYEKGAFAKASEALKKFQNLILSAFYYRKLSALNLEVDLEYSNPFRIEYCYDDIAKLIQNMEAWSYESQVTIAMETGDYWQARHLCDKLIKKYPKRPAAYITKQIILEKLYY